MDEERCENCDKVRPLSRFVVGVGYKSRPVRLCEECSEPVARLWSRTAPSRLGQRESLMGRLAVVDEHGRVRPSKGRRSGS